MKIRFLHTILFLFAISFANSQEISESPYKTNLYVDGAWITGVVAANTTGLILMKNKQPLTQEELNNLNKDDVWAINRWSAGYDNEKISTISDYPLAASLALPFLFTLDGKTRQHAGQLSVMYVESVGSALAVFTITSSLVEKSRPRVYNTELEDEFRMSNDNQRSFFSGHVAAAAAGSFFAAQVYSDFYPDSKAKPYVWATAALLPAAVGYFRIQSGHHFLTDVLVGYTVGAASGILIPRLHKKKDQKLSIVPQIGSKYKGIGLTYTFK